MKKQPLVKIGVGVSAFGLLFGGATAANAAFVAADAAPVIASPGETVGVMAPWKSDNPGSDTEYWGDAQLTFDLGGTAHATFVDQSTVLFRFADTAEREPMYSDNLAGHGCAVSNAGRTLTCSTPSVTGITSALGYVGYEPLVQISETASASDVINMTTKLVGASDNQRVTTWTPITINAYTNRVNQPALDDAAITGTGTPGQEVRILDARGELVSLTTVSAEGTWSATAPAVTGTYTPVFASETGQKFSYRSTNFSVDPVFSGDPRITGSGKPGEIVVIEDALGGTVGIADVKDDGTWGLAAPTVSGTYTPVYGGEKQTPFEYDATVHQDSVDSSYPGDSVISGTGTPGKTVEVKDENGTTIGSTVVQPDGTWSVPAPENSGTVTVEIDGKPGISVDYDSTVYENTVDPVFAGDRVITGTGTPGKTVELKNENGDVLGSAQVGSDGTWSIDAPAVSGPVTPWFDGQAGETFEYDAEPAVAENPFQVLSPAASSEISTVDQVFSGVGIAGSTYEITDAAGNVLASGTVNEEGTWSATAETIPEGPVDLIVAVTVDGETTEISLGSYLAAQPGEGEGSPLLDPALAGGFGSLLLAAGGVIAARRRLAVAGR